MSAGRFKSKDDYFSHRSGLAEQVIAAKSQPQPSSKSGRRRGVENTVPSTLLRVHFCKTVESFEITGKGRFHKGEYPLDDALQSHLDGATTMLVNPVSPSGETAFSVVRFDLTEGMDHPFSKARQYVEEVQKFGISSLIEVTEGGKGHYHLWIFHEQPVPSAPFSEALVRFGRRLFGVSLETVPPLAGQSFIPLPLQGESVLLQRRVFVNAVGKMIKEQGSVLQGIEYCPKQISDGFISRMSAVSSPRPPVSVHERGQVPTVASFPPAAKVTVPFAVPPPFPVAPPKPATPVDDAPVLELVFPESPTETVRPAASPAPPEPPGVAVAATVSVPVDAPVHEKALETGAGQVQEPLDDTPPLSEEPPAEVASVAAETGLVPPPLAAFVFRRNGVEYGIAVDLVDTVAAAGGISILPGAGNGVRGTLATAGRTVTVWDIGALVERASSPLPGARVIVLKARGGEIGLLADSVGGMAALPRERIAQSTGDGLFRGVVDLPDQGRSILLPDVDRLFAMTAGESHRVEGKAKVHISPESHVLFSGGGRQFALPARMVREILPDMLAERSRSQESSGGVTAAKTVIWRGEPLPVVDIRTAVPALENLVATTDVPKPVRGRILVLRADTARFGVRVDAIAGIRVLSSGDVEPRTGVAAPVGAVVRLSGLEGEVQVLDPERVGIWGMQSV